MKRFLYSFTAVISIVLFFSLCYYMSFQNTVRKMEEEKKQQTDTLSDYLSLVPDDMKQEAEASVPDKSTEVSAEDAIITSDTICVYELYHLDTGEQFQYEARPTSDMAGLTRNQLNDKLNDYVQHMSVMEFEEGLIRYELVSFSPQKVVMRKIYDGERVKYKYYVSVNNNEVVVYYSDKKTVFEYTGILCENLQDDFITALEIGIPVKDLEELYDYLSGITS